MPATLSAVTRFDSARAPDFRRDGRGFLRSKVRLTRVGVFRYQRADGSIVKELRPEEEVGHADSLASLAGAPVTDLHPAEPVTPANARDLGRGHVVEDVRLDSGYVESEVVVDDEGLIAAIEADDRAEVSCGYTCRIDATPGTFQGEAYDQVQRDIRYNHAAIGPRGWGRAGPEVALRADSDAYQLDAETPHDEPEPAPVDEPTQEHMIKLRIDGGVVEVSEDSAQAVEKAIETRDDAAKLANEGRDAARAELAEAKTATDKAEAERDDAKAKLVEAQEKVPADLQAAVSARIGLERSAAKVLGDEVKLDSLSDSEVRAEVLKKARPTLSLEERSDDYITALFDAAVEDVDTSTAALAKNRATVEAAARADSNEDSDEDPYAARNNAHASFKGGN